MEAAKKKLNKWELARYLIDAKKCVDSIIFIEDNKSALLNIGIRDEVSFLRQRFYINCGTILDAKFPKAEKRNICATNKIINSIYYERDKNSAHKDTDYRPKDYATLMDMAEEMKLQLNCIRRICAEVLPDVITLNYVSHDRKLFRQIYHITPEIEEQIKKLKHPMYGQIPEGANILPSKKVFNDTEEIHQIPEENKDDYAIIMDAGINAYEGVQNRQDWCIKINVLFGYNAWAQFNPEGMKIYERLRELGFYDECDIIQLIPNDDPRWREIKSLLKLQIPT